MAKPETVPKSNEALLAEFKKTGSPAIKQELALRYLYIVKSIAYQMRGVFAGFTSTEDIVQEGVLALMTSLDKYDLTQQVKFETFITKRIRGLIIDIARKQDWVPRSVRKMAREIDQTMGLLYQRLQRYPTDEEMAEALGLSLQKYREEADRTNIYSVLSLDTLLQDPQQDERGGATAYVDVTEQPEKALERSEAKRLLIEGLGTLRENEQLVLSLYYQEELSMKDIAHVMEISKPRVSQIHANALRKLRLFLNSEQHKEDGSC